MTETCYACNSIATTREHVPPACLFPEAKDNPGDKDLRRNLITVPSCENHNLAKSADDEYFLWVLSTNIPANSIAQRQVFTKLSRSHMRRPALGKSFFDEAKDVYVKESHSDIVHEAVEVPLDGARFERALKLVSLGIYRHHFNKNWHGSHRVHADFVAFPYEKVPGEVDRARIEFYNAAQRLFASEDKHGENPDVFYFQIHQQGEHNGIFMRLVFYEGCTATAMFGVDSCY